MCSRPKTIEQIVVDIELADMAMDMESIYLRMGHMVLYAMPNPIDASMLIKNWGIPYPELMNDPANAPAYLTTKKQAINLGVYITNITTAMLYEQTQTALRYRQAITTLIEALGLQSIAPQSILQQLEDNINDKNRLLEIISTIYADAAEFLTEDDRAFFALAMLSGGWVEGMFIATAMVDENLPENMDKMKQIINENKITFDLLWQALGELDDIPDEAVFLMLDMSYLAHLFGHQTLISAQAPQRDPHNNIDNITPKFFAEVKEHIRILRTRFVSRG